MELLYIIGPSCAGKSTVMRAATKHLPVLAEREYPVPHVLYPGDGVQLGRFADRGNFPGTDGMGYNSIDKALPWLVREGFPVVLGEGDRFANARFFETMRWAGYRIQIVYLDAPWELTESRRAARGRSAGDAWLKGRHSKCRNLAGSLSQWTITLDASQPAIYLALQIRKLPAFLALDQARQCWARGRDPERDGEAV